MRKDKDTSNNLAIIGASGTGKTVLAVGLYATSTPEFTVSPVGDETRKYIEVRQSALEEGFWPAATNESDNIDLRLRLHANGKQSDIVFREYMGERMEKDPNYIREVIGTPKAAMILFNPGMPGLKSAESRNRMIGNLKVIAQHLKDNKCAAVALVVTASDRLASDLADFREDFEQYVSLITNHLGNLQLNWRRFDVTVSGELSDQNKPKLARGENNTTHEPFLWLLDCIHTQKARGCAKKIAAWTVGIVVCAFAIWSGLCAISKSKIDSIESEIVRAEAQFATAWETKNESLINTQLSSLWKCATNTLPTVLIVGSGNRTSAERLKQRLSDDIDVWGVRSLTLEYDSINAKLNKDPLLLSSEKWAKEFDDRLKVAKPSATKTVTELSDLKRTWANNRISMETKWQVAKLNSEIQKKVVELDKSEGDNIPAKLKSGFDFLKNIARDYPLVQNGRDLSARLDTARTNALARYCASITNWSVEDEMPPVAEYAVEQKLKSNLLGKISEDEFRTTREALLAQQKKARENWEEYQFPKRVQKHVSELKAAGANPASALKSSLSFLSSMTNDFPTIEDGSILQARDQISNARRDAIKSYDDSIATTWDVQGENQPEFDDQKIHDTVLTEDAITSEEWNMFFSDMQKRLNVAKQQWDENQKKRVDSFDVEGDIQKVVRTYGEFVDEYPSNPYLPDLHDRMENRLLGYFASYVNDYYEEFYGANRVGDETYIQSRMERAQQSFNEFRNVCLTVSGNGWSGSSLQNKKVGEFARLCVDRGGLQNYGINAAFEQTITITKVEARFDPTIIDSDYIQMILGGNLIAERWKGSSNDRERIADTSVFSGKTIPRSSNRQWVELWSGSYSLRTNPWTFTKFVIQYKDHQDAIWSSGSDTYSRWLWLDKGPVWDGRVDIRLNSGVLNRNTEGTLYLRITYDRTGPDFKSLWKEAGME